MALSQYLRKAADHDSLVLKAFSWCRDISYVGMTNVHLAARLRQFELTITGRRLRHGGADRVHYAYPNFKKLAPRLFLAVSPVIRQPNLALPDELRLMGEVAALEYVCLAKYAEIFHRVPRFNNPASPKFSSLERATR